MVLLPSQERKQFSPTIEMLLKGCSNFKKSIKILERVRVKKNTVTVFLSLDIHSILYRISVFNSIAIIVPCVIICSLYQCTVYCIWGSVNIL